jgi:Cdc6-like AAA superfamily ATPase
MFLGPTGTGKTRVVEVMAQTLFGDVRSCIKINCAEFQHSHEIAKLIGSPPGEFLVRPALTSGKDEVIGIGAGLTNFVLLEMPRGEVPSRGFQESPE